MFGWFKRKGGSRPHSNGTTPGDGSGGPIIAALLIEGETFDIPAVETALRKATIAGRSVTDLRQSGGMLSFRVGDDLLAIAPMPAPYPWEDLAGPCETSWLWPRDTSALSVQGHRTHVLVTAIGGSASPVERRLVLTRVLALAADRAGVMGVYWPEGTLVHHPGLFIEMVQSITDSGEPPLMLWVDFRVFLNEDRTSGLFTTGLRPLGQMELEIPRMAVPPGDLRQWALNIAFYVLEHGSRMQDGHTLGMSAQERILIRHRPSSFGQEGMVMQLQC